MKFWSRAVTAAAVALAISVAAASAAPTPAAPSAPRGLRATPGDHQVTLTWGPPTTGTGIDNYIVSATPADFPPTTLPNTTFVASSLTNGRTYAFTVRAHNSSGWGAGAFISATPNVVPPGPPTNLAATQIGPGQIRLDWTPPTSSGSMPDGSSASITRYNITINPGGTNAVVPASTLTYSVSGVADNITYAFTVSATNTRPTTGRAAVVYAPLPSGASIGLSPTAGVLSTTLTVTGDSFLKNESITLYWDLTTHIAATVVSDASGAFTKVIKPRPLDKPGVHKLCVNVQPRPCASFALQGPPSPTPHTTPTPVNTSPSPSSAESPQASGARPGGGGLSGLDIITRPPFVFLPIIGIIGILGVLAYWLLSRRRRQLPPVAAATVVHRATRPDYMAPFPTSGTTPAGPQAPAQPSAWDAPVQYTPPVQPYIPPAVPPPAVPPAPPPPPATYTPTPYVPPPVPPQAPPPPAPPATPPRTVEWPAPPNPPAAPDEPPDLPQPSDY